MALVYLVFAALHLTTRCISVGVHLASLLPDRLLLRPARAHGHTLRSRPLQLLQYLSVLVLASALRHLKAHVVLVEHRALPSSGSRQCIRPPERPGHHLGLRGSAEAQLHLLSFANGHLFKPSAERCAAQGAERAQAPSQENWTKVHRGAPTPTHIHSVQSSEVTPPSLDSILNMWITSQLSY